MNLTETLRVRPGQRIRLDRIDPDGTPGARNKEEAMARLEKSTRRLADLQYRLYADGRHALLIVLQALDAAGKDGTIRHVMSGLNPQGCRVTSFKVPTPEERAHDFLWRIHKAVPALGEIGIFNRSHYEDVLVVRVHDLAPREIWKTRYDRINDFERLLSENRVCVLKFFLHISRREQEERFRARVEDPARNWKLAPADFEERKFWDAYMRAYEDVFQRCSTPEAPWFIIPANHKWYRNFAISRIVRDALARMDLAFPKPSFDVSKVRF